MKVSTTNEYAKLHSVIVGRAENMSWPMNDHEFNRAMSRSTYPGTLIRGQVPEQIIKEATEDLKRLCDEMQDRGIQVYRPTTNTPHWSYSARDIILTVGDLVIQCPTPFTSRKNELQLYPFLEKADCKLIKAPTVTNSNDPCFDAANVLKMDDKLLYSLSHSANEAGAVWLQEQVGTEFEVVPWRVVKHDITHVDSTLLSLNKNTILVNASRVHEDDLPGFMKDYEKIWVNDVRPRDFVGFPYSSKWIGMNILSLDPETVIVDEIQLELIEQLRSHNFNVIGLPMRQSRTLGGGFHCVTCDIERY